MNLLRSIVLLGCGLLLAPPAGAQKLIATSGSKHVQLVELYSSESCSSCPPADEWISELKNSPQLWKEFVPVVFHVDYWNNLGWKDDFSSEPMTKRQVDLSKLWPTASVYTPAFIVDGKEWASWRESKKHSLPDSAGSVANSAPKLSLYQEKNNTSFTVKIEGQNKNKKFIIRIAKLGMNLKTHVVSGENVGRTLKHNFVVLIWESQSIDGKKSEIIFHLPDRKTKSSSAIVAWIEEDNNPTPLQATGGYL